MVTVPVWFAAGVIDNVRVEAVSGPTTTLAFGTSVVLLEVPVMLVKGVAASPTLKMNVGNAVSSLVDLSEMSSTEGSASNAPDVYRLRGVGIRSICLAREARAPLVGSCCMARR